MPQLKEFNLTMKPEGQSAPMTREQLMAAERDAKRRRVKHRAAKVHTRSKNYSEVLREVINNQMLAYEDWIKENFGNQKTTEAAQPEMRQPEEVKHEKQEMVWLDWDFRGNTHTRWKYVLEREKRRKEREERDNERQKRNFGEEKERNHKERTKDRSESSSRRQDHKEEPRKREIYGKQGRDKHSEFKSVDNEASHSEEKKKESSRSYHNHSRHRDDYDEKAFKRGKFDKDHKSKYNEKNDVYRSKYREKTEIKYQQREKYSDKNIEYSRDESNNEKRRKWDRYDGFHESGKSVEVKREKLEEHNFYHSQYSKSYENVSLKSEYDTESSESSDSSSDSSQSDYSKDSKRNKKRKKSKKKHKRKHKKKHRKES